MQRARYSMTSESSIRRKVNAPLQLGQTDTAGVTLHLLLSRLLLSRSFNLSFPPRPIPPSSLQPFFIALPGHILMPNHQTPDSSFLSRSSLSRLRRSLYIRVSRRTTKPKKHPKDRTATMKTKNQIHIQLNTHTSR